jgi:phosphatidate phosphatase APP1
MRYGIRRLALLIYGITLFSLLASTASLRASTLRPDERVILYPALASRTAGGVELEIHGHVCEPEKRRLLTGALQKAFGLDEERLTPAEAALFLERCRYFMVDNERGKKLRARLEDDPLTFGASAANGHFHLRHLWTASRARNQPPTEDGVITELILFAGGEDRPAPLEVHFLTETGLSVISDIDDTIKISDVLDKSALLKNTFCRPFKPVEGMAEVYRGWERAAGARFHYVTASPWQLYAPLAEFTRSNGFPAGSWHMRDFRWKDGSALKLFASPERYKPGVIEPLLRKYPKRTFVLVGDSGEKDPEIYGALARKYPRQIARIFIRDVTGEDPEAPRYRRAVREVPAARWRVFQHAAEISDALPAF